MSSNIIAIFSLINGNKKWVESIGKRNLDKKYAVTLTDDVNHAHDFEDLALARQIIPSIQNPFERSYQAGSEVVTEIVQLEEEDLK